MAGTALFDAPGSGYNSFVEAVIKNKGGLAKVAKEVLRMKPGIIALEGPLGAGKTAFTKELAKIMGIKDEIISPTFVLHRQYGILNHIDCWRMEGGGELEQLGFEKMLDSKSIVVIEWAERVKDVILKYKNMVKIVWIKIDYLKEKNERGISYEDISN